MSQKSNEGATFRAIAMLLAFGGCVWLAWQHTQLPQLFDAVTVKYWGENPLTAYMPQQESPPPLPDEVEYHSTPLHAEPLNREQSQASTISAERKPPTVETPAEVDIYAQQASFAEPATGRAEEAPAPGQDYYLSLERRLRALGMTYAFQETTVGDSVRYRYFCKVMVAGNTSHAQSFEAVSETPLGAMQSVLNQVKAWRRGDPRPGLR